MGPISSSNWLESSDRLIRLSWAPQRRAEPWAGQSAGWAIIQKPAGKEEGLEALSGPSLSSPSDVSLCNSRVHTQDHDVLPQVPGSHHLHDADLLGPPGQLLLQLCGERERDLSARPGPAAQRQPVPNQAS